MSVTAIHASTGPLFGDGATVDFPFDFMVGSTDEVGVLVDGAEQSASAYSVTLNSNGTGTITFVTAPDDGAEVLPFSDPNFEQTTTFGNAGAFQPTTHDRVNDAAARRDIFLRDRALASLRAPRGETLVELPSAADRAGMYVAFDAEGDPVASAGLGSDSDLRTDLAASTGGQLVAFSPTGGTQRTAQGKLADLVSIKDFNPTGDGAADDRVSFVAAEAATAADTPIIVPPGSYKIASDLTISRRLIFMGGKLVIPTGVTVTLAGGIEAPAYQIFQCTGTGEIVFEWQKTKVGYMEWWGGKPDNATDNYAAFMAANKALLLTNGLGGTYLFSATPKMIYENRAFHGIASSKYQDGDDEVTRFLVASGTQYGIQIGPDAEPASINDFLQGIELRNVYLSRTIAPVIASACNGVRNQYTLNAKIENVKSSDSMVGFGFYGSVGTKCIDCEAVRATAGSGAGTDYWRGYWADGAAEIGAAGGNASLYLIRPVYGCNLAALQTGDSKGLYFDGDFTDLFVSMPEGTNCKYDIHVEGNAASGLDTGNCDLRIEHSTSDQFHHVGIFINNLAAAGVVQIDKPYCGPSPDARASLWFQNSQGTILVTAGELDHHSAPTAQPVILLNVEGTVLNRTAINECGNTYPVIGMDGAANCDIAPVIKNESATGAVAIQLANTCKANTLRPIIKGKASAFTKGIDVSGTADARNEYNLTGIDSDCIAGGSANKLVRNAVQITAVGTTGTNYVSGVVA